jgi:hypothetical protein
MAVWKRNRGLSVHLADRQLEERAVSFSYTSSLPFAPTDMSPPSEDTIRALAATFAPSLEGDTSQLWRI